MDHATVSVHDHETTHTIYLQRGGLRRVMMLIATAFAHAMADFAADDFAAALVTVAKLRDRGVRLTDNAVRHTDVRWHYDVSCQSDGRVRITAHDLQTPGEPPVTVPVTSKRATTVGLVTPDH